MVLWIGVLAIVPLFVNPLGIGQSEPDKTALLLTFTGLLAGQSLRRGIGAKPKPSWLEWTLGVYVLTSLIATVHSIMPAQSLWGDIAWRNGLLQIVPGVLLFWLVRDQAREPLIRIMLFASGLVALYGILQYLGIDPTGLRVDTARVNSTLVHANLLAAYLAMLLPITLLVAFRRRAVYILLLALQGLCLVFTYSRGGWLAAFGGLAVFGLLGWGGQRRVTSLLLVGAGAALVGLLLLSLLPPLPPEAPQALQALTNMFRGRGATAQVRLLGWQAALEGIAARPLFGYGLASYRTVSEWYMPSELAPYGGPPVLDGHAHNRFLEITIESGLVGLAAYATLLAVLVRTIVRAENSADRQFRAAVLGALSANLINSLFSFDTAVTGAFFWILAGMALSPDTRHAEHRGQRFPRLGAIIAVSGLLAALWMSVPHTLAFIGEARCGEPLPCTALLDAAVALAPVPEQYMMTQAHVYALYGAPTDTIRGIYARLIGRTPTVPSHWEAFGAYLQGMYVMSENPLTAREALAAYTQAIQLSPRNPDLWIDRALLAVRLGDMAAAQRDLETAGTLRGDYLRYYGAMATFALAQEDYEQAAQWTAQAERAQRTWEDWLRR